jgi:hypothetical protein
MTSLQVERAIESELSVLNQMIDRKILQGRDYSDEARRHKMLRGQMRKMRTRRPSLWGNFYGRFGQVARFASFL